MLKEKFLSALQEQFFPSFVRDNYPNFVAFFEKYLEWLEDENNPYWVIQALPAILDVDRTDTSMYDEFIKQYMPQFPTNNATIMQNLDVPMFVKLIRKFYETKGTEASAIFIFNLLNKTIEIYYPKESIFLLNEASSTLNGRKKIHDNYYYAYYTYEITVDLDFKDWEELAKASFHPAGTKMFGRRNVYFADASAENLKYGDNVGCGTAEGSGVDGYLNLTTGELSLYEADGITPKAFDYNILCQVIDLELFSFISNNRFRTNDPHSQLDSEAGSGLATYRLDEHDLLQGALGVFQFRVIKFDQDYDTLDIYSYTDFFNDWNEHPSLEVSDLQHLTLSYFATMAAAHPEHKTFGEVMFPYQKSILFEA